MPQRPAKVRLRKRMKSTRTVTDIEEPELERPEYVPDESIKGRPDTDDETHVQ